LQRFTLFLGQPIYTYAVVLASLLIFTGMGSSAANRFRQDSRQALLWIVPAILAVVAVTSLVMPWLFSTALGLALFWRVVITIALVAPLGLLLGMPFPAGLSIVAIEAPSLIPWAWAVNGFFTVIGSVGAVILGMALGFTAVLAIAAGCYLAAIVTLAAGTRAYKSEPKSRGVSVSMQAT